MLKKHEENKLLLLLLTFYFLLAYLIFHQAVIPNANTDPFGILVMYQIQICIHSCNSSRCTLQMRNKSEHGTRYLQKLVQTQPVDRVDTDGFLMSRYNNLQVKRRLLFDKRQAFNNIIVNIH